MTKKKTAQVFVIDPISGEKKTFNNLVEGIAGGAKLIAESVGPLTRLWREDYKFYGRNQEFFDCTDRVVVLSGPAETGKTIVSMSLVVKVCLENKNARCVIARKVREDMGNTVIQSFKDSIVTEDHVYYIGGKRITGRFYGGEEKPTSYNFSNGSVINFVGLDKAGKVLSGAFNIILVNQAEELEESDFQLLTTRVTGRGTVKLKGRINQLLLDCNPGPSDHWILNKRDEGKLTMFASRHRDNPTLYNQVTGKITEQGEATIEVLQSLTGVFYDRYYLGKWVMSEDIFFRNFNPNVHGIAALWDRIDPVNARLRIGMDFGYNHPNVIIFAAQQGGFIYVFDEIVTTELFPQDIAPLIFAKLEFYGLHLEDFTSIRVGTDAFAKTGRSKKTVVQQYKELGIKFTKAYADPGSRVVGSSTLSRWLGREETKEVKGVEPIFFYDIDNCRELEKSFLKLVFDPKNQEDVKKQDHVDDPYDALRYCVIDKRSAKIGSKKPGKIDKDDLAKRRAAKVARYKEAKRRRA